MVDFEYKIIRSRRKTICLQVIDCKVIVRAGIVAPLIEIEKFIDQNKEWVENKLIKQLKVATNCKIFEDNGKILLLARLVDLCNYKVDNNVSKFYTQRHLFLYNRAVKLSKKFNIKFTKIEFTNAKALWGSCSIKNNIRLNERLASLPLKLIDYVILHEFAHTIHHNHSKLFWTALENMLPNCRECRRELKEYSFVLKIYR